MDSVVVAETALASGIASSLSFLDDRFSDSDFIPSLLGWPVIGNLAQSLQPDLHGKFDIAAVALGDSSTRLLWIDRLLASVILCLPNSSFRLCLFISFYWTWLCNLCSSSGTVQYSDWY